MAKVIYVPGAEPPVNDGERRVVAYLERQLPDDFTLYPGVQVIHGGRADDVDLLVLTKHALVVVEIKDIVGRIAINNGACYVNDNLRPQPFNVTNAKARRLKSRLQETDPSLGKVRIPALVVLARAPKALHLSPRSLEEDVMVLEEAALKLVDPGRVLNRPPPHQELGALADKIKDILNLQRGRERDVAFGAYRCTELLQRTSDEDMWMAEHTVTQEPFEIRHVGRNPLTREKRLADAKSEFVAFKALGGEPRVIGPDEFIPQDDGTATLVYPPRQGQTLLEAQEADEEIPADRVILDVANALESAHERGIVHGRLSPRWIELLPELVRVRGFGVAQQAIAPNTQLITDDSAFLAPEVMGGQPAGIPADLFALGRLIGMLKPQDRAMQALAEHLTVPNPADRTVPVGYVRQALAGAFGVSETEETVSSITFDDSNRIAPGSVIGRYVVDQHLVSGGFSDVYLARHAFSGMPHTIKVFKGEKAASMVQLEFEVLQHIADPNVVRVFDGGNSDAGWYMVSEYLEGETLAQRIDGYDADTRDMDEIMLIGYDLLNALATIHAEGVSHRDVKPENVILVEDRGAVLFDFGVAATSEKKIDGLTWQYWPPDIPAGSTSTSPDLFAVGLILHELVTGEHPYPGRNPQLGEGPDLSTVPSALREVLGRAVSPVAEERYESAVAFRDALEPFNRASALTISKWDRYRRVQQLIADDRLDEAEALRLPEWKRLADLIERKRVAALEDGTLTAGILVRFDRDEERPFHKIDNTGPYPAKVSVYHVTGKSDLMLDVLIVDHGEDEVLVTTGDAYESKGRLPELVKRRRIGLQRDGENWLMRLTLTTRPEGDWVGRKQPGSVIDLSDDAGVDVERLLLDAGAAAVGKRIDLGYDQPSRSRNQTIVVFPDNRRNEVALLGYLLTTVVPLSRDAGLLLDDQE